MSTRPLAPSLAKMCEMWVCIRAQLGQCVVPLAEPVPHPGAAIGPPAALGELTSVVEGQLGFWPPVEILQREDLDLKGVRAQVRVVGIVTQHAQRPVDVVNRGRMVAPDAMAQPQIGQGAGGRETRRRLPRRP
jgi:hypothetical protein